MQDSEENLKKEKRNYAEEQLIKLGFLSKDNIEGYSKVEILSLIDYLIEIKEREEELIPKEKKQEKKRQNHFLYNDLLNNIGNHSIERLKDCILKKARVYSNIYTEKEYKKFEKKVEFEYKKEIGILRNIIRINRNLPDYKNKKNIFFTYTYKEKFSQIKEWISAYLIYLYDLVYYKTYIVDEHLLEIYRCLLYVKLHIDGIVQVIIYDILHEDFPKEIRDMRYKKVYEFLQKYYVQISNEQKPIISKEPKNIFIDFYRFLFYHKEILDFEEEIKIRKEVDDTHFFNYTKPIDKYTQLKYAIEKNLKSSNFFYKHKHYVSNFIEFPELFKFMDQNGLIEIEKLKKFVKENTTKTKEFKIIYEKEKVKNNYDRIKEAVLDIINKYPLIDESNLQVLKASIVAIENSEIEIKPFRKKLKACILDPKTRYSNIVIKYLRTFITKGNFHEKGIPEEFERSTSLEELVLNIFIEISKNKSDEYIRKKFIEFIDSFYETIMELYNEIPVYKFFTENLYNKMKY